MGSRSRCDELRTNGLIFVAASSRLRFAAISKTMKLMSKKSAMKWTAHSAGMNGANSNDPNTAPINTTRAFLRRSC
jgi:hypothetical protein